jgi:RNA polymerase sigma-70 factor (ECF subfamily)
MSEEKLASLYRTYGPIIYARCRRLLADESAAEDATQETFIRVARHIDKAPDERAALGWIYRIATNYCLNEIRDRKRRPEPTNELPEHAPIDPSGRIADRDLAARLIARAPAKLRVVAWMIHVDGMSHDEVAEVLGVTTRTVSNHLASFASNAHKFVARVA